MNRSILIVLTAGLLSGCGRFGSSEPEIKAWPEIANEQLGSGVREQLKTRWADGTLTYILEVAPVSDSLTKTRKDYGLGGTFVVQFSDESGFVVLKDSLYIKEMTQIMDDRGVPMSLRYQGEAKCDRSAYHSIKKWDLAWSLQ
jgi:hypothetical protein